MADALPPLGPAYLDPAAYLRDPRFHRSLSFTPSSSSPPLTVSYTLCGSSDPAAPCVIWINGMGHHRLASVLFDGLFAARGARLLTVERGGAGLSSAVPLKDRTRISHEALLAVLAKEGITEVSLLSHSNGIIYALYTLLHLPPPSSPDCPVRVKSWHLSSPYVPPWHSSSLPLLAARWIPPALTSRLGDVAVLAQKAYEPFARSSGWSAGVSSALKAWSAGVVSPLTSSADAAAAAEEEVTPTAADATRQRNRFVEVNAKRPPHERMFGGLYYGPSLFSRGMKVAFEEGRGAMGQEALICLRQGEGAAWNWFDEREEGVVPEGELYSRGFARLKEKLEREGWELPVSVACAAEDGIVPKKGREYLRGLLVDEVRLVKAEKWAEVEDAGHDDPLGLECVAEPLLQDVLRAHSATAGQQ
ncbi:hypothetical protein JCM10213_005789 [Rhodosporidiobolus nylandii]